MAEMNLTHRQRFVRLFTGQPTDRIPVYFFGTWVETKKRWADEGCPPPIDIGACEGPQIVGMDPDWEPGLWGCQGLVRTGPIGSEPYVVLAEDEHTRTVRNEYGRVDLLSKDGSTIPHTLVYPLEGTRESWERFKPLLDPNRGERYPAGWQDRARELNKLDKVTTFMGGSLYSWLRDYMGVVELSCLMMDDPELLEEMVATLADHFMTLLEPVIDVCRFEFVYFWEDCCSSTAPLFSPAIYKEIFDPYYKKMIAFYKAHGIPLALIDSDGVVDQLVPCFMESGFDIIFPLEVGTWKATPDKIRSKYGKNVKIFGGVDKFALSLPPEELRSYLATLLPAVREGGYLPIPDHRIPPDISYQNMVDYVRIFREVFNGHS